MVLVWLLELAVEFIGWMIGVAILTGICMIVIIVTFFRALWIVFGPPSDSLGPGEAGR